MNRLLPQTNLARKNVQKEDISNPLDDLITIVGTSYFQPITDLIGNLLESKVPVANSAQTSCRENGYSVSLIVLLVAVLESFVCRLRFLRKTEITRSLSIPDLLLDLFPDLPNRDCLVEVFLLRNIIVHNHVWHLDVTDTEMHCAPTLGTPEDFKFHTNKHYNEVVDFDTRRTRQLSLNANPTAVDRNDVKCVFEVIWDTLLFMNNKNFSHTPLAGQSVRFRGKFARFGDLRSSFE